MAGSFATRRTFLKAAAAAPAALALPAAAFTGTAAAATGTSSTGTAANPVIDWDLNAQAFIWDVAKELPQVQSRSFAIVHGSVYDAVNAIAGTPYEPYLAAPRANGHESVAAAVAAAAHQALLFLYPAQQAALQAQYDTYLAGIPDGIWKQRGIAVGEQAAAAMVAARQDDGAFGPETWPVGTEPGQWRPTPPGFGSDTPWVGFVKPFLIPSASMFRTAGPPSLTSAAYARDVNEVQAIGAKASTIRTADQTQAAIWWQDRHLTTWEIRRQIAVGQGLDALQTARLFAMLEIAEADAAIACFNEKRAWMRWRPVTAIELADTDGNPGTVADPSWLPLLVTPAHPDYTSGHTSRTAATMEVLAFFFQRDDIAFSAFSADSGTTRSFASFSQALAEVNEARIWGGIHTRNADVAGTLIGTEVTRYITSRFFRRQR
jgi:hypothetical protein